MCLNTYIASYLKDIYLLSEELVWKNCFLFLHEEIVLL